MVNLITTIKSYCKTLGSQRAPNDSCAAHWVESDCYGSFDGLQHRSYPLPENKFFTASFEIPDAPCQRRITIPEVPSGTDCATFARQHISNHNQNCFRRFQNRVSKQNCLTVDEHSDCNMDMGLLFIKWSNRCKVPYTTFNVWTLGFQTCSTASNSVTPNINKVTEIGNRAYKFCRAQAGTGSKCQVEEKYNKCLKMFTYLNRRVYRLANGTNYSYNLQITRSQECISAGEKCYNDVVKAARLTATNCNADEEKKRQESLKSPWACDHYTVQSCDNAFANAIRMAISQNKCD
jgi:hypothetical protein